MAVVRHEGKLAIVWGKMYGAKVQLYTGGNNITITQKMQGNDEMWLRAGEYDNTTRTAIDDLLSEVTKNKYWYALGATTFNFHVKLCGNHMNNMGHCTVTGINENEWEFTSTDNKVTLATEAEALNALHQEFDATTWPSTKTGRDNDRMRQALCNASHEAHTAHTPPTTSRSSRVTSSRSWSTVTPQATASNRMRAAMTMPTRSTE